jgi:PP-loop superfamily ATP-utilizing enzyme
MDRVLIAFSGDAGSTLLLAAASDKVSDQIKAVGVYLPGISNYRWNLYQRKYAVTN